MADGVTNSMDVSLSKRRWCRAGKPGALPSTGSQRVRRDGVAVQQLISINLKLTFNQQGPTV